MGANQSAIARDVDDACDEENVNGASSSSGGAPAGYPSGGDRELRTQGPTTSEASSSLAMLRERVREREREAQRRADKAAEHFRNMGVTGVQGADFLSDEELQELLQTAAVRESQLAVDETCARSLPQQINAEQAMSARRNSEQAMSARRSDDTRSIITPENTVKKRRAMFHPIRVVCLCGAHTFKLNYTQGTEVPHLLRCHCQACRRAHGAPSITLLEVETPAASELHEQIGKAKGLRHAPPRPCSGLACTLIQSFCVTCGSVVLLHGKAGVFIPAGCLRGLGTPFKRPQITERGDDRAPFYQPLAPLKGQNTKAPTHATGSCICGQVAWSVRMPHRVELWHCHCKTCQRWCGADLQTWVGLDRSWVTWKTEGLEKVKSSSGTNRGFCRVCGSTIGMEYTSQRDVVYVAAGAFDQNAFLGYGRRHKHEDIWPESTPPWSLQRALKK